MPKHMLEPYELPPGKTEVLCPACGSNYTGSLIGLVVPDGTVMQEEDFGCCYCGNVWKETKQHASR